MSGRNQKKAFIAAGLALFAGPSSRLWARGLPGGPAAMVSDISGSVSLAEDGGRPLQIADDLFEGQRVELRKESTLRLIYLQGCREELLSGPRTLRIGKSGSEPPEAVQRSRSVPCDIPTQVIDSVAAAPAALVLRGGGVAGSSIPAAEEDLRAGLQADPHDVPLIVLYATRLESRGEYSAAAAEFEKLSALRPESGSLAESLALSRAARSLAALESGLGQPADPAAADAEVAAIMRERRGRLARITGLKTAGRIGEARDGLVSVLPDSRLTREEELRVKRENRDRSALLRLLTRPGNAQESLAAKLAPKAASIRRSLAQPGEWYQTEDGRWRRK